MNRIILSLSFLIFLSEYSFSQPVNVASKRQKYEIAMDEFERGNFESARIYLQDFYKEDKDVDILFKIAECHYHLANYEDADKWFERGIAKDKRGKYSNYAFLQGKTKKYLGLNQDAMVLFREYIGSADDPELAERAKKEIEGIEYAKRAKKNEKVKVSLLSESINKKTREYAPKLVGLDDIYYASRNKNSKVVLDGEEKNPHLRIFHSTREGSEWSKPEALDEVINREGINTTNVFVTDDGRRMYFNRIATHPASYEQVELSRVFMSMYDGEEWGPATAVSGFEEVPIVLYPVIGELFGKEVMFFSADISGGYGGLDIYYAERIDIDEYGSPVNLGEGINSKYDEVTPYYVDGRLYFSSDGRPGIGGLDIYVSDWNGSQWSVAENVGRDLNSEFDDWYFSIDENGTHGVMTSNRTGVNSMRGANCCDDIFSVFIDNIEVNLIVNVNHEGKPVESNIYLHPLHNGVAQAPQQHRGISQNWPLQKEHNYRIIASADGLVADTIEFNTLGIRESTTITKTLNLKTIPVAPVETTPPVVEEDPEFETYTTEEPIRLNNIYYDYDDDKILLDAHDDLKLILDLLNQYPDMVIELGSHTDARGIDAYNQDLSSRRAQSAKNWLLTKGVNTERINAVGYGESRILNQCTNGVVCSDVEHRFNRRTEFRIVSGPTSIKIEKKRLKKK